MYRELSTYEIRRRRIRRIRAVLLVAVAIALLVWAIGAFQHAAREQSAASIRSTVLASAAQCYAIEGSYPASISRTSTVWRSTATTTPSTTSGLPITYPPR